MRDSRFFILLIRIFRFLQSGYYITFQFIIIAYAGRSVKENIRKTSVFLPLDNEGRECYIEVNFISCFVAVGALNPGC